VPFFSLGCFIKLEYAEHSHILPYLGTVLERVLTSQALRELYYYGYCTLETIRM